MKAQTKISVWAVLFLMLVLCVIIAFSISANPKDFQGTLTVNNSNYLDSNDSYFYRSTAVWYGDGSDGNVNLTGSNSCTRTMYYRNLYIHEAAQLSCGGYLVFVNETLYLYGSISRNGGNGGNGASAQTAGTAGTVCYTGLGDGGAGLAGGAGGAGSRTTGSASGATGAQTLCFIGAGVTGGTGGSGSAGAGGAFGAAGACTATWPRGFLVYTNSRSSTVAVGSSAATGGGGAGGDGVNYGGGGGGAGAAGCDVFIGARNIVLKYDTSRINATGGKGGNGGTPGGGNTGGGGGGGGGNGGVVRIQYERIKVIGTPVGTPYQVDYFTDISANFGGSGGGNSGTGSPGTPGSGGTNGHCIFFDTYKNVVRRGACKTASVTPTPTTTEIPP